MVKIYCPINDTWSISKESLQGIEQHPYKNISKVHSVFTNVYFSLQLGYTYDEAKQKDAFDFQLFLYALSTTANICVWIKNLNYKFYFKNISSISDYFCLPSNVMDLINSMNENLEIEINGMFIIKRDEYPAIPSKNCLNETWGENDKDFDIIIIDERKNEEKIQIHKELLIAQSNVFERMLNSGMEESKTNTFKIIDFNAETVKSAVEFFYGNDIFTLSLKIKDALELLRFADKYFIDNLTDSITTFISYRLTPSNVNQVFNFANASTSAKLQQMCSDFIIALKETENITDGNRTVEEASYE